MIEGDKITKHIENVKTKYHKDKEESRKTKVNFFNFLISFEQEKKFSTISKIWGEFWNQNRYSK